MSGLDQELDKEKDRVIAAGVDTGVREAVKLLLVLCFLCKQ